MKRLFNKLLCNRLAVAAVLMATWIIFTGELSLPAVSMGGLTALVTVILLPERSFAVLSAKIIKRFFLLIPFVIYALAEIFIASYKLAYFAFNPRISLVSSIIQYEFGIQSSFGVLLLSTVITLTPGTLVVDVSNQKRTFYVHTLAPSETRKDAFMKSIGRMEKKISRICE